MILAAIYILWMYQRTMNGPTRAEVKGMPDLRARELWAVGPLIALIIALGVYPQPVLKIINPAVRQTMAQVHATDPPATVSTPARTAAVKGATP
jgi:NADH-quinone oxidoreductase subunit M